MSVFFKCYQYIGIRLLFYIILHYAYKLTRNTMFYNINLGLRFKRILHIT